MAPSVALPDSPRGTSPAMIRSPSWGQHRRSDSNGQNTPYSRHGSIPTREGLMDTVEKLQRRVLSLIQKMTPLQRLLAGVALVVAGITGLLFLIFSERILHWLAPFAEKWKHTTGAWIILWLMTFATAFPPMIGYSSCGTIAGFVYGVGEGWLILTTATIAGSYCSFIVSRTVLRKYVERLVANDTRFAALTLTLKEDGLKLLCMIRLCPLPYSLSNGAMSTFPTVQPQMYALATAIVSPKLFIPVFIGSRFAKLGQGNLSTSTKLLSWVSILFFGTVGVFTGWFIYQKTMTRAREIEQQETQNVRDSVRRTGGPPAEFQDDPEAQVAAETLARDYDEPDYFDDTPSPQPFHDETDEEDVFGKKDDNANDSIGLQNQRR